ncbi:MAG: hypothetical protein JOS17DRAFT_473347 [Linnemannia elongata]|nr:MAG: hypothetical protein JOS17DRAFT_473347 [Linnemannia elongata]
MASHGMAWHAISSDVYPESPFFFFFLRPCYLPRSGPQGGSLLSCPAPELDPKHTLSKMPPFLGGNNTYGMSWGGCENTQKIEAGGKVRTDKKQISNISWTSDPRKANDKACMLPHTVISVPVYVGVMVMVILSLLSKRQKDALLLEQTQLFFVTLSLAIYLFLKDAYSLSRHTLLSGCPDFCFLALFCPVVSLCACVPLLPVSFDDCVWPVDRYASMPSPDGSYRYLEGLVSTEGGWTRRGCQHILLS